jgi:two-component system chemotaxis response regulator CheY
VFTGASPHWTPDRKDSAMKQCLIVDDSRIMRKIARKILEQLKFVIDEAEDGAAALDHCRHNMPDAILLDCNMPTGSGVDFLRVLRREPNGAKPIVVFCTTENDVAQITEAIGAGANEYLVKPFDKEIVQTKLAEVGLM